MRDLHGKTRFRNAELRAARGNARIRHAGKYHLDANPLEVGLPERKAVVKIHRLRDAHAGSAIRLAGRRLAIALAQQPVV